jgi:hypothetical protein
MLFPFLTSQWKAPKSGGTLYAAQNQAARDGAVLVNYLYDFYRTAYDRTPTAVEAHHFSLQCDMSYGEIWVHWREDVNHHMEHIHSFSLRDEAAVAEARGFLRNIVTYATGERLLMLREALPLFAERQRQGQYPSVPYAESTVSSSIPPSLPPTSPPASRTSEPSKKRARQAKGQGTDSGFHE